MELLFLALLVALAYTLVVYPVTMFVIGRLASRRRSRGNQEAAAGSCDCPFVSIIVPAFNEEVVIEQKVRNCLSLDYPLERLEVLVASDGSTDRTVEIVRQIGDKRVKLLAFPQRRGKPTVLNDAVAQAQGELLCITDANVVLRADTLRMLVGSMREGVGAVTALVSLVNSDNGVGTGEGAFEALERGMQAGEQAIGSLTNVDGGVYLVRKELFPELPPDILVDDLFVSLSLLKRGYRIVTVGKAVAWEHSVLSASDEFRRRMRIGAGAVQVLLRGPWPSPLRHPVFFWQYVSHRVMRWLSAVLLPVFVVVSGALAPTNVGYAAFFGAEVACCLAGLAGALKPRWRKHPLIGVPFYFALAQLALLVGIVRGILGLQPVTWHVARRAPVREEEIPTAV